MCPCPDLLLGGYFVQDSTVPFFPYVPDQEARNYLPESVQKVVGVRIVCPPADGVDDVAPFSVGASA